MPGIVQVVDHSACLAGVRGGLHGSPELLAELSQLPTQAMQRGSHEGHLPGVHGLLPYSGLPRRWCSRSGLRLAGCGFPVLQPETALMAKALGRAMPCDALMLREGSVLPAPAHGAVSVPRAARPQGSLTDRRKLGTAAQIPTLGPCSERDPRDSLVRVPGWW